MCNRCTSRCVRLDAVLRRTKRAIEIRLLRMLSNRSRGCQTPIDLCGAASSQTHLVLQAYWLTNVDEINPLGIDVWYRTTRRFSILDGIEAIRSVPKKYRTRYPDLYISSPWNYTIYCKVLSDIFVNFVIHIFLFCDNVFTLCDIYFFNVVYILGLKKKKRFFIHSGMECKNFEAQ